MGPSVRLAPSIRCICPSKPLPNLLTYPAHLPICLAISSFSSSPACERTTLRASGQVSAAIGSRGAGEPQTWSSTTVDYGPAAGDLSSAPPRPLSKGPNKAVAHRSYVGIRACRYRETTTRTASSELTPISIRYFLQCLRTLSSNLICRYVIQSTQATAHPLRARRVQEPSLTSVVRSKAHPSVPATVATATSTTYLPCSVG